MIILGNAISIIILRCGRPWGRTKVAEGVIGGARCLKIIMITWSYLCDDDHRTILILISLAAEYDHDNGDNNDDDDDDDY